MWSRTNTNFCNAAWCFVSKIKFVEKFGGTFKAIIFGVWNANINERH